MAVRAQKPEGMTWEEWVEFNNQQNRGEDDGVVTGSAMPSDNTPVKVKQPVGMAPGGYNYKPYVEYEIYEDPAKNLVDLNNSQSWLSRVLDTEAGYDNLVAALQGVGAISSDNPTWGTVATAARQVLSSAGSRSQEFWSFVNDRTVKDAASDGPSSGGSGLGRAPRMPSRTEQVDLINDMRAPSILNAAMQEAIGRNATKKEVDAFVKLVNSEAEDNPRFQQNTPVGLTNTDIETGGGIDTNYLAEQFAGRTPGAKEYRLNEAANVIEDLFAEQIGLF